VYFQGYGWIDFDTTVPDINTQQASQPDGTPPTDVPATYLVIDGEVENTDTIKKLVTISTRKILYHDSEFVSLSKTITLNDVSLARITSDTGEVKLKLLVKGTHVTAISHAEVLKNIFAKSHDSLQSVIKKLPIPIPIDEVKIITKEDKNKLAKDEKQKEEEPINWLNVLYGILIAVCLGLLLVVFSPWLIWLWLNAKAKKQRSITKIKAYHSHKAMLYYLNQMGYSYQQMGSKEYAEFIDKQFNTSLVAFNTMYQKIKYSKAPLSSTEADDIQSFYDSFIKKVKSQISFSKRMKHFFNLYNTLNYFSKPKIN
jgi:hypothetical protein